MDLNKVIPQHTEPETTLNNHIESITFVPQNKYVYVYYIDGTTGEPKSASADLTDDWAALSQTKKDDWKAMFKKIVALAFDALTTEVTGDIWD